MFILHSPLVLRYPPLGIRYTCTAGLRKTGSLVVAHSRAHTVSDKPLKSTLKINSTDGSQNGTFFGFACRDKRSAWRGAKHLHIFLSELNYQLACPYLLGPLPPRPWFVRSSLVYSPLSLQPFLPAAPIHDTRVTSPPLPPGIARACPSPPCTHRAPPCQSAASILPFGDTLGLIERSRDVFSGELA